MSNVKNFDVIIDRLLAAHFVGPGSGSGVCDVETAIANLKKGVSNYDEQYAAACFIESIILVRGAR